MATEKWIAGTLQGLTWSADVGSAFVTIVQGNAIISGTSIDNSTALDIYCDVSYLAGGTVTTTVPGFVGVYLYPLASDGSTYGDGQFGSSTAGPPPSPYWGGNMTTSKIGATTTMVGTARGIILPPGIFKFVFYNQTGATIPSSSTVKYRTYNRSVA